MELIDQPFDPLDKRQGEDPILSHSGPDDPRLMAGLSVWQQSCREGLCDGYAALLLSAP
jgi:hypothetical protein